MSEVEVCPICDIAGCRHIRERKASMATPTDDGIGKRIDRLRLAASAFRAPVGHIGELVRQANLTVKMLEALRAQLAEANARADRAEMDTARLRDASSVKGGTEHAPTQFAFDAACNAAEKHRVRADRAEAALAAQIEADAWMLQDFAKGHFADGMVLERAALTRAATIIRAQPHDRSALDKALAEAEARGYQLASDEAKRSGLHLRRYDLAKRDAELATP